MRSKSSNYVYYTIHNWGNVTMTLIPPAFFENFNRGMIRLSHQKITFEQAMNDVDEVSKFLIRNAYFHENVYYDDNDLPPFLL